MSNKTKAACYLIRCLTNTHVGSGDDNYGTIDKLVQRDPLTGFPEFHASGMKGALREFFEVEIGGDDWRTLSDDEKKETKQDPKKFEEIGKKTRTIFGSEKEGDPDRQSNGKFKFMDAKLLALPKWSNKAPYFMVITAQVKDDLELLAGKLACTIDLLKKFPLLNGAQLQATGTATNVFIDEENAATGLQDNGFGAAIENENIAVAPCETMKTFCKNLPVIARNQLENSISQNLWYEEVLPRETRMYWFVCYPEDKQSLYDEFHSRIEGAVVQIGANASIGYGQCLFTRISKH